MRWCSPLAFPEQPLRSDHARPYNVAMEADRLNQIEYALHDLASRAQELRRYL
jgi:hypothetical protein